MNRLALSEEDRVSLFFLPARGSGNCSQELARLGSVSTRDDSFFVVSSTWRVERERREVRVLGGSDAGGLSLWLSLWR